MYTMYKKQKKIDRNHSKDHEAENEATWEVLRIFA